MSPADRDAATVKERPQILYIAGTVRSGSTILGRLLGETPGTVPVGEIKQIWKCIEHGHLCECGARVAECPFWSEVLARVFDSPEAFDAREYRETLALVDRLRYLPARRFPIRDAGMRERLSRYGDVVRKLYEAVTAISGCRVIVDGSKSPLYGHFLRAETDINLLPIHLVRDSRAVAFSTQRRRRDPSKPGDALMPQISPLQMGVLWNTYHLLLETNPINDRQMRIRYEDFAKEPDNVLQAIAARMEERPAVKVFAAGTPIDLPLRHTIAGNPSRFDRTITIRPDTEWHARLSPGSRALVTLITLPLLLRYGYLKRRHRAQTAGELSCMR